MVGAVLQESWNTGRPRAESLLEAAQRVAVAAGEADLDRAYAETFSTPAGRRVLADLYAAGEDCAVFAAHVRARLRRAAACRTTS